MGYLKRRLLDAIADLGGVSGEEEKWKTI